MSAPAVSVTSVYPTMPGSTLRRRVFRRRTTPLTPCLGISDGLIGCSQGQSAISDKDTQYNFSPRVTKIHGRHNFVAGGQFEFSYDNYLQTNTGGGLISFNGFWTEDKARGDRK